MPIDNVLKPKSEDEIKNLEERGFRKNAGKWKFTIDISQLIKQYDEDDSAENFRQGMVSLLSSKIPDIDVYAGEKESKEFASIIEEFRALDTPTADSIDDILNKLYDWADFNNVWIESI